MKQLIVALDDMPMETAIGFAKMFSGKVWGFKVNDLLLEYGVQVIKELRNYGEVFADPKLHDTPGTVFNAASRLSKAGASIITVHASGGADMLKHALNAVSGRKTTIAAVTTLTSLDDDSVRTIYRGYPVQRFTETFREIGITTVVCAGRECDIYKALDLKAICPGFRPFGKVAFDDQKRLADVDINADYFVVGRPILSHADPVEAIEKINEKFKAY
jgi:orotidine-5'-phosphate decarboxylase